MATWTVKQSGGDYSTLASALSNASTGAGDTISIEGTWTVDDTAAATVADDNITIQVDSDSRAVFPTASSPSNYRLRVSSGSHCLTINNTGCVVDGVEIQQASSSSSAEGVRIGAAITATLRRCLIYCDNVTTNDQDGIYVGNYAVTLTLENCAIWNCYRCGFHYQNYTGGSGTATVNVNSCSVWNCGHDAAGADNPSGGIGADAANVTININVFNSAVLGNTTHASADDFAEATTVGGTITWNIDYCISSDGSISARDGGAVGSLENHNETDDNSKASDGDWVIWEDITTAIYDDLRLQSNSFNEAQDMHSSASGAGLSMPSIDIAGTSRPQTTNYDCGCFEIPVVAGVLTKPPDVWRRQLARM